MAGSTCLWSLGREAHCNFAFQLPRAYPRVSAFPKPVALAHPAAATSTALFQSRVFLSSLRFVTRSAAEHSSVCDEGWGG